MMDDALIGDDSMMIMMINLYLTHVGHYHFVSVKKRAVMALQPGQRCSGWGRSAPGARRTSRRR